MDKSPLWLFSVLSCFIFNFRLVLLEIPSRSGLNIATALPNPPEMLLNPNPNGGSFPIQEQYPPMEQHAGVGPSYGLQDVLQYGPPETQYGPPPHSYPPSQYPVQSYAPPPPPVYQYPGNYSEQYQDQYVLTQLTEPSKPNYPVQSYPIHEPSYGQPEFTRIFPDEPPKECMNVKKDGESEQEQSPHKD